MGEAPWRMVMSQGAVSKRMTGSGSGRGRMRASVGPNVDGNDDTDGLLILGQEGSGTQRSNSGTRSER
jgi:hypothetical protein